MRGRVGRRADGSGSYGVLLRPIGYLVFRLPGRREIGREADSGKPIFERRGLRDAYVRPLPSRRHGGVTGALRVDTSASAAYSTLLLMEALQSTVDRQASAA
jgi:hypothetical protein